jgi:histidine ammonia-lyase
MSAAAALKKAGLKPYRFEPKEALSLINGTPFTAALMARVLADAEDVIKLSDIAGAMSLEALKGSLKPFDPRFHRHRPHPGQLASAHNIRALTTRSSLRTATSSPAGISTASRWRSAPTSSRRRSSRWPTSPSGASTG